MPSAHCSPAPSAILPTPSWWWRSQASASGGEDPAHPGQPGHPAREVGRWGWAGLPTPMPLLTIILTQGWAADSSQRHGPGRGAAAPAVCVAGSRGSDAGCRDPTLEPKSKEELQCSRCSSPGLCAGWGGLAAGEAPTSRRRGWLSPERGSGQASVPLGASRGTHSSSPPRPPGSAPPSAPSTRPASSCAGAPPCWMGHAP